MTVYAVKRGYKTGVFESWPECQEVTSGFSGAEFKSFKTKEEAEAYLQGKDIWVERVTHDNSEGYLVAFTDGSYDNTLQRYSYGVVFVKPDGTEETICGYGKNQKYIESKNIIGEIFGVIYALDWAISNDYDKVKIYHDYEGLSKWASGEWKAKTEASKMYVNLYQSKYEGILSVTFEKVSGHSNISYNEKADELAKIALIDRKKVAIRGDNWYSIPYFPKQDFDTFAELVVEQDKRISYTRGDFDIKSIYRFKLNSEIVTVTWFSGGKHKLLVQGKNTYLFHVIATSIVELYEDSSVENILGSAYRVSINHEVIDKVYRVIVQGLPKNYPVNIKRLIKQSIINLNYYIECEDYSQYAVPAYRALEGHIKFLINSAGGSVGKVFNNFNRDDVAKGYYYTGTLTDISAKKNIEICYNYYKSQRDTSVHFGDFLGSTDTTRFIPTKEEADEIINKCLSLINETN